MSREAILLGICLGGATTGAGYGALMLAPVAGVPYAPARYRAFMGVVESAAWGLAGGTAAGLLSLSAAVVAAGFRWPWHDNEDVLWPHLFVAAIG